MNTVLYYPTFLPPSSDWIRQCLLFWDRFATIIPEKLYPTEASDDLRYLERCGVYHSIDPSKLFGTMGHDEGEELLDKLGTELSTPRMKRAIANTADTDTYPVSNLKLPYGVHHLFMEHGLLAQEREWVDTMNLKRPAALAYMSLLATFVAEHADSAPMQLATDQRYAQEVAFERGDDQGVRIRLQEALPRVRDDVPYDSILEFRDYRREELLRFREFMNSFGEDDADQFRNRFDLEIIDYRSLLKDANLLGSVGSLEVILSLSAPAFLERLGLAEPIALATGGVLVAGQIAVTHRIAHRAIRRSPVSYLFSAADEGLT